MEPAYLSGFSPYWFVPSFPSATAKYIEGKKEHLKN
jgi:hypothetical protein